VHDLHKTHFEVLCDVFVHDKSPSLGFDNIALSNPIDHFHVSPICSLPSPSPEYDIVKPIGNPIICNANNDMGHEDNMFCILGGNVDDYVSLGYLRGYDPSIDPYCVSLRGLPKKIKWTTIFNLSYDFSKAIDEVKRMLNVFGTI